MGCLQYTSAPRSNALPCSRCAFPRRRGKGRPACIARRRRGCEATSLFCCTQTSQVSQATIRIKRSSRMTSFTVGIDVTTCADLRLEHRRKACGDTRIQYPVLRIISDVRQNCNTTMIYSMLFRNRHATNFVVRTRVISCRDHVLSTSLHVGRFNYTIRPISSLQKCSRLPSYRLASVIASAGVTALPMANPPTPFRFPTVTSARYCISIPPLTVCRRCREGGVVWGVGAC